MCARATRKHDKSKDSERNECMNTTGRPANCRVHDRVVGAMEANYQRLCGAGKKEKGKQRWRNDTSEREKVLFKTIDNGFPASPIVEYQFKWGNSHQLPLLPQTPSPFGDRNELSLPTNSESPRLQTFPPRSIIPSPIYSFTPAARRPLDGLNGDACLPNTSVAKSKETRGSPIEVNSTQKCSKAPLSSRFAISASLTSPSVRLTNLSNTCCLL